MRVHLDAKFTTENLPNSCRFDFARLFLAQVCKAGHWRSAIMREVVFVKAPRFLRYIGSSTIHSYTEVAQMRTQSSKMLAAGLGLSTHQSD
jgi:hypothetical protein